jgi:hypothetical protein
MSQYAGPHPEVANGNALTANKVEDSFDRFATAVNAVDDTNFSTDKVITYRSVHPGALTQTFDEGQLLYGEPAAWVSIGRGGTGGTTNFSLGPRENLYTVDGCSVRVVISGNGVIKVNSFIQIESIKLGNQVNSNGAGTMVALASVDMDMDFKLKYMKAGETHGGATTLHTVTKRMKLLANADYATTKLYRRGFTVDLSDDVTISDADSNGSAYDFFVTIEPTITAAAAGGGADRIITNTGYNDHFFLTHLRSHSRYTTARVFLK